MRDKKGRIIYLVRQLYEKKTESGDPDEKPTKRKRGHQPGQPSPKRRDQSHLEEKVEIYDLGDSEKYCSTCGLPFNEMSDTDGSEVLETQDVSEYRRTIKRKKYIPSCKCPGNTGIVTAKGPAKLMPNSRYGSPIWIHILIRKYRFQIPVARILKNLSLHGLSIPTGSVGDGLKRLASLFEPVYAAMEERSQKAAWWQADETRWSVFETLEIWKINQLEWLSDYFRACALAGGNPPRDDVTKFLPWNIKEAAAKKYIFCGREFNEYEIENINKIVGEDTTRNRNEISRIACEQLQRYKPDGKIKVSSMNQVLLKMEAKNIRYGNGEIKNPRHLNAKLVRLTLNTLRIYL